MTTFSATYNNAAQLTGVTNNLSNANYPSPMLSNAMYNGPGQIISAQIGTGSGVVTETRAYDKRLRPTTLTDGAAYSFDITNYAPNGNILAVTDSANGSWAYGSGSNFTGGYDDMNRLLMAVPTGKTWSYTYAYDRYGNRWQQNLMGTGGSGTHFSTTFDANNHVSDGSVSYDAAGNVMQDATNSYTYDSANQLIAAKSRSTGVLTCYLYDASGRRVQKISGAASCGYPPVGGASLYYVYDLEGRVIDEVSAPSGGTGSWTRQEIYAGSRHLATFTSGTGGQAFWDFSDWLGTERARVNAVTGGVAETCSSLPWGDNLQCTGTDESPLHFTGKQRDSESGLDNFGARYMGSSLGRFMSPDSKQFSMRTLLNPQKWNKYAYTINNPLRYFDPNGMEEIEVQLRAFIPQSSVAGFNGDNRGFTTAQNVTSRTAITVRVETDPSKSQNPLLNTPQGVAGQTQFNPTGTTATQTEGLPTAQVSRDANGNVVINLKQDASNPLVPGAPPIKSDLTVTIPASGSSVTTAGTVSGAPAFELNVSTEGGTDVNVPLQNAPSSTPGFVTGLPQTNPILNFTPLPPPPPPPACNNNQQTSCPK